MLILLLSLFGWISLSDYVRAEFLKGRNMDYVNAARTLGLTDWQIITKHILPNSLISVVTFLPFRISGAILILTSLDFLGLGVPSTTPSLGELLSQGKEKYLSLVVITHNICSPSNYIDTFDIYWRRYQRIYKWKIIMTLVKFDKFNISLISTGINLVQDLSFKINKGESFGIVGESGSGKSLTALSVLGLLNKKIFKTSGHISIDNKNLNNITDTELNNIRGNKVSMIFQEPMLSLNPVKSLRSQIIECIDLSDKNLDISDVMKH